MRSIAIAVAAVVAAATPGPARAQVSNPPSAAMAEANKHYSQGWSAVRAGSWDDAKREFERTIGYDPQFALAFYALGRAEMGRRDFSSAIAAYTHCRDLYLATSGMRFTNQMEARSHINDMILQYQNALRQANAPTSSTNNNAAQSNSIYIRDLQAAIARLQEARDRTENVSIAQPVPYFVPMALGAAYFRAGRTADAEREYKAALAANNSSGETHNNLAVLYLMTGRYDEADAEVKAAEKVGFKVAEELKGDIRNKKRAGGSR